MAQHRDGAPKLWERVERGLQLKIIFVARNERIMWNSQEAMRVRVSSFLYASRYLRLAVLASRYKLVVDM